MHVLNTENKLQSLQCILYTQKQVDIISIHVFLKSDNNCNYFKAYFKHRKQIAIIFMYVLNKDNKLKLFFLNCNYFNAFLKHRQQIANISIHGMCTFPYVH